MKSSYTNPYTQAYLAAKQELESRLAELDSIQKRIEVLRGIIQSSEPVANIDTPQYKFGNMADLCCAVLGANPGRSMTVQDVLRAISIMGINLKYSNPAGIVHTTLKRLSEKPNTPVRFDSPGVTFEGSTPVLNVPMKFFWNPEVPPPSENIPFPREM